MAENSRLALMILTGSRQEFETQFASTRLRICFGERSPRRPGERVLAIANFSRLFSRKPPFEKSVFRRDAEKPARQRRALPYCSWRNQRSAMEVWASLTSWPPWNVPIRIR